MRTVFWLVQGAWEGWTDLEHLSSVSTPRRLVPLEMAHGVKLKPSLLTEPRCSRELSKLGYVGS